MQLFKNPGVIAVDVLCNAHWEVVDEIIAHREIQFAEIATPATIVNEGQIYVKDFAGATEMCYLDAAGNEVQVTTGGVVNSTAFAGTLDIIADGAVYGKVVLSSLTAGEVIKLTDAGGDDLTFRGLGASRQLTLSANVAIDQSLTTGDSPTFAGLTMGAGTGVLYATAGVLAVGTLDNVPDGVTQGRVLLSSLNTGQVIKLTEAGGFDMTVVLGADRILTLGADVSLDQDLQIADSPEFAGLTLTGMGGVLIATAGVISDSGDMDDIADGATYGRVLNTSLTGNEVTKLTDAGGDDLTIALGGSDWILTMGASLSLDQSLRIADIPVFAGLDITAAIEVGSAAVYGGGEVKSVTTVQTADATVTTLGTLALEEDKAYIVTAEIIAEETTAPSADRAAYSFKGLFYRVNAGAAVQEGATSVLLEEESDAAWDCDFDVNANNVRVRVTGAVATTINWKVVLTYTTIDRV